MAGCGRKLLRSLFFLAVVSSVAADAALAADVTLAWDANTDSTTGYKVYCRRDSQSYGPPIDVGDVTTCTVSGLGPGMWYFAVTAYNALGLESGFSNEVCKPIDVADTKEPVISLTTASPVSSSFALISWTTDERADSQVEYGPSLSYGFSTSLDAAPANQHSRILTGLEPGTLYHFRVWSRDAAGNAASSGDHVFTTLPPGLPDTAPPVISSVGASGANTTTVLISWTTNEPADSQVEFGTTAGYGFMTGRNTSLLILHSQALAYLLPGTLYHYRVLSTDEAGNLSPSEDFTFTTASPPVPVPPPAYPAGPSFYFPGNSLLPVTGADPADAVSAAVAITNLDIGAAGLRFTAIAADGTLVTGPELTNPAVRALNAGEQAPILDSQIFGSGIGLADPARWVRVESSHPRVTGLFMLYNSALTLLDGAGLSSPPQRSFVMPEIQEKGGTRILLGNPNADPASVRIETVDHEGSVRSSVMKQVPAHGTKSEEFFAEAVGLDPSGYIRVISDRDLLAYESFGGISKDVAILSGLGPINGGTTLFAPQYVFGGRYRSSLSIVNLDAASGSVILKLFRDDGSLAGERELALSPGSKIRIVDPGFFHDATALPDEMIDGYIQVISSGINVAGSLVLGDVQGTFLAAAPLMSTLQRSGVFGHVESNDLYFTGLAILNPGDANAAVAIELYDSTGILRGMVTHSLAAYHRRSLLLTEYFPELVGQDWTSGYFRVTADRDIACFAVLGARNLSVLAAIPAQPMP